MPAARSLLGIVFIALPVGARAAEASPPSNLCGCSWSIEKGCSISSKQLVRALDKPKVINDICAKEERGGGEHAQSCALKNHMADTINKFRSCLQVHTNARDCYEWEDGAYCQWEAQEDTKCGIDPEKLVAELTNASKEHPFVRWVLMTDICADLSEQYCNANPNCRWVDKLDTPHSRGLAHCDIDEGEMVVAMMTEPPLYLMMRLYMRSAICLRNREHSPNNCPKPCEDSEKGCKLPTPGDLGVVLELYEATCRGAQDAECVEPCQRYIEGDKWVCGGPDTLPGQFYGVSLSDEDARVVYTLLTLSVATNVYHQQCSTVATKEECGKIEDVCKETTTLETDPNQRYITTFGLSDTLASMLDMAYEDTLVDHVEKYLQEHPRSGRKALKAVVGDFNDLFQEELSYISPTPAPAPRKSSDSTRQSLGLVGKVVGALVLVAACLGLAYGRVKSPARTRETASLLNRELDMYRAGNDG